MIWTNLTHAAYAVACVAHSGQVDKGGAPYICHPLAVAETMPDEASCAVALLHDVLEDSDMEPEALVACGVSPDIVASVIRLTRPAGVSYFDYIRGLKSDPVACLVKKADLCHNMDLSRLGCNLSHRDESLVNRYQKALDILSEDF